jgi:hypothetical protein
LDWIRSRQGWQAHKKEQDSAEAQGVEIQSFHRIGSSVDGCVSRRSPACYQFSYWQNACFVTPSFARQLHAAITTF